MSILIDTCWKEPKFTLLRRRELSRTAGGVASQKDLGPSLWRAELASYPLENQNADALYARLLAHDMQVIRLIISKREGFADPLSVNYVSGGGIRLDGLPAEGIAAGVYFSVITAGGRETFQATAATLANESVPVVPEPRAVQAGNSVEVNPATVQMLIEPGSLDCFSRNRFRKVVSFSAIQVIS